MKKILLIFLYLSLFMCIFSPPNYAGDVSISVNVEPETVRGNQDFRSIIVLSWIGEDDLQYEAPAVSGEQNCHIIGHTVTTRVYWSNQIKHNERKFIYTYKPVGMGKAYTGSVHIMYTGTDGKPVSLHTDNLSVRVTTPVRKSGFRAGLFIALFLVVGAGGFGVWFFLHLRRRKSKAETAIFPESEEEKILRELDEWKMKSEHTDTSQRFSELIRFIRKYLNLRIGTVSRGMMNKEYLDVLPSDFPEKEALDQVLEQYEQLSFANEPVKENDVQVAEDLIRKIINVQLQMKESENG